MKRLSPQSLNLLDLVDRVYSDTISGSSFDGFLDEMKQTLSLNVCFFEFLRNDGPEVAPTATVPDHRPRLEEVHSSASSVVNSVQWDKLICDYMAYYHTVDPTRKQILEHGGLPGFFDADTVLFDKKMSDTEFYNDFLKKNGSGHLFRGVLGIGNATSIAIGFDREASKSGFTKREQAMVLGIMPHLKNAAAIKNVLTHSDQNDAATLNAQQQRGKCGFILDALGNVVSVNDNAAELTQSGVGVNIRNGKLNFVDANAQKALEGFLGHKLDGAALINMPQLIEFSSWLKPYPVYLKCRAVKKALDFSANNLNKKYAMLEISSPWAKGWPPIRDVLSCQVLTFREKQALFALITQASEVEAARELDISLNTLRTHRKNLYDKMMVENRRMLIEKF